MTSGRFDPSAADRRWQARWDEAQCFRADSDSNKPKTYVLEMFPYPSGRIHMGHVRNYTMGDVLARYRRLQGMEVLHPMGWDAFGMPAENAAMERKVHPGEWTRHNIDVMREQLKRLGFALDWSREFATCDPAYYGQEQALFLDLFDAGLVYRKESEVNWDPVDMTVLANEQVIDGRGWRSGAIVERRKLAQWFLKITDFADDLLEGLQTLDDWPDKVRLMQENWIGKSKGLDFRFRLAEPLGSIDEVEVFTTPPDTIFGASFVAIAAGHPIAQAVAKTDLEAAEFIAECQRGGTSLAEIEAQEKKGYRTSVEAVHPLDPEWRVPVYIANFVLMDYGTGALFGSPGHDQRDFEFATKYNLPIRRVVAASMDEASQPVVGGVRGEVVAVDAAQRRAALVEVEHSRQRELPGQALPEHLVDMAAGAGVDDVGVVGIDLLDEVLAVPQVLYQVLLAALAGRKVEYRVIRSGAVASLIECRLHSGRTHQIRVHLHHLGHPVLGDKVYAPRVAKNFPRQMLHAWKLGFHHPRTGEWKRFEAQLPADFKEAMAMVNGEK